ncbi:MAG TPA: four helix bundle protein [Bacteroidales bacterium]|mgnify:CR=1 FL=1|nr:four helix bundle protein [Bacteroidales bacterium]HPS72470.1 four helix bundle protein [Bacteroidales bacterium]
MNEQENTVSFFRFEDLRIYAKALDYITWLHGVIANFPDSQYVVLGEPFLKSAQAIALHIAEGSARNKAQFVYYLKMAKSSVRECVVYTEFASKLSAINNDEKEYSRNQLMELTKMIGSLVASLQRSVPVSREDDDIDGMPEM